MPNTQTGEDMSQKNLAALDAALEDLNLGEAVEEIIEATDDTVAALDDDAVAELESTIDRAEAYASQEATPMADPSAVSATPAKTARTRSASSTPRVARDLNSLPDETFVLEGDGKTVSPTQKADTIALRPTQVKIAEKFDNLFSALAAGKEPSTYVMIAFKLLDEKKTVTSADIIGAYKASGLGEGTARSQSGQIMNLFATVKIASRSGSNLALNENSAIAAKLRGLASPAAA